MNPQDPLQPPQPLMTPEPPAQQTMTPQVPPMSMPVQPQAIQSPTMQQPYQAATPVMQQPFAPQQQYGMPASMPKPGNKKLIIIIVAVVLTLLAVGAVVAVSSGSKDKNAEKAAAILDALKDSTSSTAPATEKAKETAAVPPSVVTVNKTLTADLGYSVTVIKAVRNFQDEDLARSEKDKEAVVVEIKADMSQDYSIVVSKIAFKLVASDGQEYGYEYLINDADLTAAGFTPLPTASAKKGQPVTGHIAFSVPKNSGSLVFRYKRPETKVFLGNGQTLPKKDFDIQIAP